MLGKKIARLRDVRERDDYDNQYVTERKRNFNDIVLVISESSFLQSCTFQ